MKPEQSILFISKTSRDIYGLISENRFKNYSTGSIGELTDDQVKKNLVIPVPLNVLVTKHPLLLDLIDSLGLTSCKQEEL